MIIIKLNNIVYNKEVCLVNSSSFSIEISGHSYFDKKGSDIVCSAVSVLAQTLILTLSRILKIEQGIEQRDGFLKTTIAAKDIGDDKLTGIKLLIESFLVGVAEINGGYPERVKIEIVND